MEQLQRSQGNAHAGRAYSPVSQEPVLQGIWDEEYARNSTIPSSHRSDPAHALVELFNDNQISANFALDLGCGNGRNAFFLADMGMHVSAIDFSQTALGLLAETQSTRCVAGSVEAIKHDLLDGIPFDDASLDLVLDSYCLCHFIKDRDQSHAIDEIQRVLKPGGQLIKIHLDNRDTYYLERLYERTSYGHISYDPANGLMKMHCSLDSYARHYSGDLVPMKSLQISFVDNVRGQNYERSIFASVLQKI